MRDGKHVEYEAFGPHTTSRRHLQARKPSDFKPQLFISSQHSQPNGLRPRLIESSSSEGLSHPRPCLSMVSEPFSMASGQGKEAIGRLLGPLRAPRPHPIVEVEAVLIQEHHRGRGHREVLLAAWWEDVERDGRQDPMVRRPHFWPFHAFQPS